MTSTGFTKEQKTELQVKVERMGGIYSNAFHDGVTHIICSLVRFVIYQQFLGYAQLRAASQAYNFGFC